MFVKRHPIALMVAGAAVAWLLTCVPASAARYGRGRGGDWGGYRNGWNGGWNGGGWNWGNSDYDRDWDGYRGYNNGYRGYYPGYYNSYDYTPGYYDSTPFYNNSFYFTPGVDYSTASYFAPAAAGPQDRAQVEVRVPAPDAQVFFDGAATQQQGMDRMFVSPAMTDGKPLTYNIEARWTENGKPMSRTKSITLNRGETSQVDFGR